MCEMKDSGINWIGEIPRDWEVIKNKYLFLNTKEIVGEEFEKYQLLSLTTQGIKLKSVNDVAGKVPESYTTYQKVQQDDMIMCLFDLDVSAVFSGKSEFDGMISPAYRIFKCRSDMNINYADRFFQYVFNGRKYMAYSKSLRYTINTGIFNEILTIKPPLPIQQRIADYLDQKCAEIDAVIEKTKATIEEYKKLKQSVITEAVTKGLNPNVKMKDSGIEGAEKIPRHWKKINLRFLGSLQNGISKNGDLFGTGFPFLTYGDVYKNICLPQNPTGLVQSTLKDKELYSVQKGDVFFTRTSETIEEIGISSTCLANIDNATFAGFLIRFRPNSNLLNCNFSKYFFRIVENY